MGDASFLFRLRQQSTGSSWTEDEVVALLQNPLVFGWGVFHQWEGVGFILFYSNGETVDILEFVVDSSYRRQGLGEILYQHAEAGVQKKALTKILLEVSVENLGAQNFYRKKGFNEIGLRKRYYQSSQGKDDALVMHKRLIPV